MDLKSRALEIDRQLRQKIDDLYEQRKALFSERLQAYEEYRAADPGHDRSENAPLDAAINHIKEVNAAMITNAATLKSLTSLEDLTKYNPIGMVVMYSTVHLRRNDGEEFCYRIYPEGVSYPEYGVIAADSRLATVLIDKVVGDVVGVEHVTRHETLNYEIIEIY